MREISPKTKIPICAKRYYLWLGGRRLSSRLLPSLGGATTWLTALSTHSYHSTLAAWEAHEEYDSNYRTS